MIQQKLKTHCEHRHPCHHFQILFLHRYCKGGCPNRPQLNRIYGAILAVLSMKQFRLKIDCNMTFNNFNSKHTAKKKAEICNQQNSEKISFHLESPFKRHYFLNKADNLLFCLCFLSGTWNNNQQQNDSMLHRYHTYCQIVISHNTSEVKVSPFEPFH